MIASVRGEWWRWLGVVAGEGAMFLKRTSVCVSHGGGGTLTVCRSVRGRFTRLSQIALVLGLDGPAEIWHCKREEQGWPSRRGARGARSPKPPRRARREATLKFPRRQNWNWSVVKWIG